MLLRFLGSGSGLCSWKENYQSNMVFIDEEHTGPKFLLGFDCGSSFPIAAEELGLYPENFDGIFVSHLHADHIGGLEFLGFKRYFSTFPFGQNKPDLYGNTELLECLWRCSLSGGMESLQGERNKLSTYFNVKSIPPNGGFTWRGHSFELIQTVHVVDNRRIKPSYGLMVTTQDGRKTFVTGDTQFAPHALHTYYEMADQIFNDCELASYVGSVHAQYRDLVTLPEKIKNKMWLYHYSGTLPETHDGFCGFVQKGQTFEL